MRIIFHIYGELSGLEVNLQKFEFLATSLPDIQIQELAHIMGCVASKFPINYLDLPLSNKKL